MRPSTSRTATCLVLFLASTVTGPGVFAQGQRPDGSTPPTSQTGPAAATPPEPAEAPTPTTQPPAAAQPAAQPAPVAAKPASPAKMPGTAATVAPLKTIEGIMGKAVRSSARNEDMGHIVDVLVDGTGEVRAAVIDFGGFLGVGSRKVAVAWKTLDFANSIQSGRIKVALTRDQIRQAPEYKPDEPIVILEGTAPTKPTGQAEGRPEDAAATKPAEAAPSPGHNEDSPPH